MSIERPVDFLDVRRIRSTPVSRARRSQPPDGIAFNEHYTRDDVIIFKHACALCCEGTMSKRLGSPYRSGRSANWIKVKNPAAPAVTREAEDDWSGRPEAICLWMTQGWLRMSPGVRLQVCGAARTKTHQWPP